MPRRPRAIVPLVLVPACLAGLLAGGCRHDYERGDTRYVDGTARVRQPNLTHQPERSFEGLRVAGFDTDVLPEYWDEVLITEGELSCFERFEMRYRDLEVYQAEATGPALRSFRVWCRRRDLEDAFLTFWTER